MKQNLFWSALANAMAVLLCAAQAAEPVPDYMLYYSGEREFCLRLLNNAHKAEKIEPVIGPTHITDIDEGELYAPKLRLYIVKSPMPIPVIYKLIKQRKWMTLLGYTPWKANSSAGRMVTDPRWREYDDQCPGIFRYQDFRNPGSIAGTPTQMTLFDFDADGDGKSDKIYRHQFNHSRFYFEVADFKACTLKPIIGHRPYPELFRFEGKTYVISEGSVGVYRINTLHREIDVNDPNDRTCHFGGINRFTDYSRNIQPINKLTYRR